jgi:hypothetical protein
VLTLTSVRAGGEIADNERPGQRVLVACENSPYGVKPAGASRQPVDAREVWPDTTKTGPGPRG